MSGTVQMLTKIVWNDGAKKAEQLAARAAKELDQLTPDGLVLSKALKASSDDVVKVARGAQLHVDGKEAFDAIERMIEGARKNIQLETFTFKDDETGRRIGELLVKKRQEGLDVKMLLDTYGTATNLKDAPHLGLYQRLRDNGIEVRLHNPEVYQLGKGMPITHRKLIIADGERFMTGGMNISDRYAKEWHDAMITIDGPATEQAVKAFNKNWERAGGEAVPLPKFDKVDPKVKVVYNDPETGNLKLTKALLKEINQAKKSVRVTMPYLSDRPFIEALAKARKRGVQVEVILPRLNDEKVYLPLNDHFSLKMIDAGIQVRWYQGKKVPNLPEEHFSHTKMILIDDKKAILGSANADTRTFKANHELNVIVDNQKLAGDVKKRLWGPDWEASEVADAEAMRDVGIVEKAKRQFWNLISPLI